MFFGGEVYIKNLKHVFMVNQLFKYSTHAL